MSTIGAAWMKAQIALERPTEKAWRIKARQSANAALRRTGVTQTCWTQR